MNMAATFPGSATTWHHYSDPNAVAKGLLDPDMNRMEQKICARLA